MNDKKENSSSVAALLDEQSKPTETKEVGPTNNQTALETEAENLETSKVNPDDFGGHNIHFDFDEESEPHIERSRNEGEGSQSVPEEEEEESNPEQDAQVNIALFDTIQQTAFTYAHKSKGKKQIGSGDKWQAALDLMDKVDAGELILDNLKPEEKTILLKIRRVYKKIKAIKLREEEKEMLLEPMIQLVKIRGLKASPELSLIMAGMSIMAPRLMDVISD